MISRNLNYTRSRQNPLAPGGTASAYSQQEYVHEAVVVDVIVNERHPEYAADGYNIGAIKFRLIKSDMYKDDAKLHWALPMEANITEYPLLNEVVLITPSLNRFFYSKKINTSSRVTAQPMYGVNEEMSLPPSSAAKVAGYRRSVGTPLQAEKNKNKLGNYFKDLDTVNRLKHDEGDKIIEGRSGHSIRFGAAWQTETTNFKSSEKNQAPNILMRVGQSPTAKPTVNSPFGLVLEDINSDMSSFWMVSNQIVDLKYATAANRVHRKSIDDFPTRLTGNQIVMNSDRFVVNAKRDKIMGFSNLGIHWTTNRDFTVDVGRDYVSLIARDQRVQIDQDRTYKIARDDTVTIGRDETYSIGRDEIYKVGRDDTHTIGRDETYKVGRDETHTIGRDETNKVGRDDSHNIGRHLTYKVGGNSTFKTSGFFASNAGSYHAFVSPAVYLGMNGNKSQPVPKGADLAAFLGKLIDAHLSNAGGHVMMGLSGLPLHPRVIIALTRLKADVTRRARASFNSTTVYTK
jgi:hypothetical protein